MNSDNQTINEGYSNILKNEKEYCGNIIPEHLSTGKYSIVAYIEIDGKRLKDKIDFYINKSSNFFMNQLSDYKYLVMKNVKIGDKCYYLKMSLQDNLLKLDELNEIKCTDKSTNDIDFTPNGDIILKNITYENYHFNIKLKHYKNLFFIFLF